MSVNEGEKDTKKNKKIKFIPKEYDLAFQNLQAYAIEAAKAQQRMAEMVAPAIQNYHLAINSALPSIRAMLSLREAIDPVLQSIAETVRTTRKMQNSILFKEMEELLKMSRGVLLPYEEFSTLVSPHLEIMRNMEYATLPKIDLESIASSTRSGAENRIRALEQALVSLVDELEKKEQESSEKDELINELKRIIRELLDKTKNFYIS